MAPHTNGSTATGKSQFLFNVDATKAVLDGAAYADRFGLWSRGTFGKAKIYIENGPVGVHAETGQLTNWMNVYRRNTGFVHGAPASPDGG
jgi:hypothetical protein